MKPIILEFIKRRRKTVGLLLVLGTLLVFSLVILIPRARAGPGFDMSWWTVDDGGVVELSAGSYSLSGTTGQADAATWQGGNYTFSGGFWAFEPQAPTAVTLTDLQVRVEGRALQIRWQTGLELDLLGFNVLRSTTPEDPGEPLNAALIPAQGGGGSLGFDYTFVDADLIPGQTYYYWLELVEINGTEIHGPLKAAAPFAVYIPVTRR